MRITQNMLSRNLVRSLGGNLERLAHLQDQLSTGERVRTVSDDPVAAARILYLERENDRLVSYTHSIGEVETMLRTATDSLQRASESLVRVKELAVQAATGTYTDGERQNIADGVDNLLQSLVSLANVQAGGLYIFSGQATDTAPYRAVTDAGGAIVAVEYDGAALATEVPVGPSSAEEANLVGPDAFEGRAGLFDTLIALRDAIRGGDQDEIRQVLGDLETGHTAVTRCLGRLGERLSQMQILGATYERFRGINEEALAESRDADIAQLTVDYSSQMALLQIVTKLAAQVVPPSVIQFL